MSVRVTAVHPLCTIEGGRITIEGTGFSVDGSPLPGVQVGGASARVVHASPMQISVIVPPCLEGGRAAIRVSGSPDHTAFVDLAAPIATGIHQVDSPVFDHDGNLYVTITCSILLLPFALISRQNYKLIKW